MCNFLSFDFLAPSLVLMLNVAGHLFYTYMRFIHSYWTGSESLGGVFGTVTAGGVLVSVFGLVFLMIAAAGTKCACSPFQRPLQYRWPYMHTGHITAGGYVSAR
jgi:hypothetical protein